MESDDSDEGEKPEGNGRGLEVNVIRKTVGKDVAGSIKRSLEADGMEESFLHNKLRWLQGNHLR